MRLPLSTRRPRYSSGPTNPGTDPSDGIPLNKNPNYNYREEVLKMLRKEEVRLIVNLDDLRDYNREYADGCVPLPSLSILSCSCSLSSDVSGP